MKIRRFAAAAMALALGITALSGCGKGGKSTDSGSQAAESGASGGEINADLTANELIKLMGNGINLGNTMEAYCHYYGGELYPESCETAWGQPTTTQEMITGMKEAGFDSLRVPVAWTNGMPYYEDGDYTIDEAFLDRIEEIINYAINADMYVIINDHWDGSWWGMFGSESQETRDKALEMYKAMWTQIAERYADYSEKLIFESANEELGDRLNDKDVAKDSGSLNKDQCYETANMINQEFVDLIRSTGGNNAQRFLLIAGYNTDIANTCDDRYKMPEDSAKEKLLVSVHYYTPSTYCLEEGLDHWGSVQDFDTQNDLLEMMSKFTEQGYGVVIGEYGVLPKRGGEYKGDIELWTNNFLDNCDYYNYCPMLWDCSDFFVRRDLKMKDDSLAQLYLDRSYSAQSSLDDDTIKTNAKAEMEEEYALAEERANEGIEIPASDDKAVAWIMYNSSDYNISYSVGDKYDPTSKTYGLIAQNVEITGEGTYTVGLDFSECGAAKGVAFSALGISNGETFFPGYVVTIDEIKINGTPIELAGDGYTSSDDGKCTRVNLYNEWVSKAPDDARGVTENASAQIMPIDKNFIVTDITITFTYSAP